MPSTFQSEASNKHTIYHGSVQVKRGGEPFCQFVLPLNWLGNPAQVKLRYDWTSYKLGQDFCRYFNTWGWRTYPIWDYKPRKHEVEPFAMLQPREVYA